MRFFVVDAIINHEEQNYMQSIEQSFNQFSIAQNDLLDEIEYSTTEFTTNEYILVEDSSNYTDYTNMYNDGFEYSPSIEEQNILEDLNNYVDNNKLATYVGVGYPSGEYVSTTVLTDDININTKNDYNPTNRDWYKSAVEADGEPIFVDIDTRVDNGDYFSSISKAFYNENSELIAVMFIIFDINELYDTFIIPERLNIGNLGVIDGIYYINLENAEYPVITPLEEIYPNIEFNDEASNETLVKSMQKINGNEKIVYMYDSKTNDCTYIQVISEDSLTNLVSGLINRIRISIFIISFLVVLLVFIFTEFKIIKHIAALGKKAESISLDKNYMVRFNENRSNEFGNVSKSFNKLLSEISLTQIELQKRIKEAKCLSKISEYVGKCKTISEVFNNSICSIPEAWVYSSIAVAVIQYEDRIYCIDSLKDSYYEQNSSIIINGVEKGKISVHYISEIFPKQNPFLEEEQVLLDDIAHVLSLAVENYKNQEILENQNNSFKKELKKKTNKLEEINKASNIAFWLSDSSYFTIHFKNNKKIEINDRIINIFGMNEEGNKAVYLDEFLETFSQQSMEYVNEVKKDISDLISHKISRFDMTIPYYVNEKKLIWVRVVATYDDINEIIYGVLKDVTDLKQIEFKNNRLSDLRLALVKISNDYGAYDIHNSEQDLNKGLSQVCKKINADRIYIFKYDNEKRICYRSNQWIADKKFGNFDSLEILPFSIIPKNWQLMHKKNRMVEYNNVDDLESEQLKELINDNNIKSFVEIPLFSNGNLFGFWGIDFIRTNYEMDDQERTLLNVYSEILVNFFNRVNNEKDLMERELSFRNLFEYSSNAIHLISANTKEITETNKQGIKIFNSINKNDIIGKHVIDISPINQSNGFTSEETIKAKYQELLESKNKRIDFTWSFVKIDGTTFEAEIDLSYVTYHNKDYIQVEFRDITERLNKEKELIKFQNRNIQSMHAAKMAYWELDLVNENTILNQSFKNVLNIDPKYYKKGNTIKTIDFLNKYVVSDDIQYVLNCIKLINQDNIDYKMKYRFINNDNDSGVEHVNSGVVKIDYNEENIPIKVMCYTKVVTDIVEKEILIKQSEQNLKNILESTLEAIFIVDFESDDYLYCNPAALNMYKIKNLEELFKTSAKELCPDIQPDGTLTSELSKKLKEDVEKYGIAKIAMEVMDKNGKHFPSQLNVSRIIFKNRVCMNIIVRDLTEYKLTERKEKLTIKMMNQIIGIEKLIDKLQIINTTLIDIFNVVSSRITIIGKYSTTNIFDQINENKKEVNGKRKYINIISNNHLYDDLFTKDSKIVLGKLTAYSILEEHKNGFYTNDIRNDTRVSDNYELNDILLKSFVTHLIRTPDGEVAGVLDMFGTQEISIKDNNRVITLCNSIGQVITATRAAESIKEAKEIAENATKTKSDFLANMSHEIRTPMNSILSLTEFLGNTSLDSQQKDHVQKTRRAATTLLEIINDILDFSKIEAGKLEIEKIEFNINDLLSDVVNVLAVKAHEKEIELVVNRDCKIPNILIGDGLRLNQILINLVSNAIKFTEVGYVMINLSLNEIDDSNVKIRFEVKDTGIGVENEKQNILFDPFSQADASTTRNHGGTGLGLSISTSLAKAMKSEIKMQSIKDKGSSFYFDLDLPICTKCNEEKLSIKNSNLLNALIVDESQEVVDSISYILNSFGIQSKTIISGKKALKLSLDNKFDIVIINYIIQKVKGIDIWNRIKQLSTITPYSIFTTNYGNKQLYEQVIEQKINQVIVKPVMITQLYNIISSFFNDDMCNTQSINDIEYDLSINIEDSQKIELSIEEVISKLDKIIELLEIYDSESEIVFNEIFYTLNKLNVKKIIVLRKAFENYEFDTALKMIKKVKESLVI